MMHHLKSPSKVIKRCKRILSDTGVILIRYSSIEQIRGDIIYKHFPETREIDEARFPARSTVENWLNDAGFKNVVSEEILQKSFETGNARLNAVKIKNLSVLTLIPQGAFERGVCNLEKCIEKNPNDPLLLFDKRTLTVGYKTP